MHDQRILCHCEIAHARIPALQLLHDQAVFHRTHTGAAVALEWRA